MGEKPDGEKLTFYVDLLKSHSLHQNPPKKNMLEGKSFLSNFETWHQQRNKPADLFLNSITTFPNSWYLKFFVFCKFDISAVEKAVYASLQVCLYSL